MLVGPFHPFTLNNIGPILGVGLAATIAQLAMTRAYHSGENAQGWRLCLFHGGVLGDCRLGVLWRDLAARCVGGDRRGDCSGIDRQRAGCVRWRRPALPAEED